ncbi:MAG: DcuS/MalK family sensor histidine kinase [Bacillus sp. (in: firmicutes)]
MKNAHFLKKRKNIKLQTLILLLVFSIVLISILITGLFISRYVSNQTKENLSEKILNIARMTAQSDIVIDGLKYAEENPDDRSVQEYSVNIAKLTDVGFVVILDMDLMRLSHPLEEEIGKSFYNRQDAQAALKGEEYFSTEEGPLGVGVRVFSPVKDENGTQIGIAVVGVSYDLVEELMKESRQVVYLCAVFPLLFGAFGAFLLSKYVRKKLFNLEPFEIAKLLEERETMIESVKEGILAVNANGEITLVNEEARRLMNVKDEEMIGKQVKDYMPIFEKVIRTGESEKGHEEVFYGRTVLMNCFPIEVKGEVVGGIGTFRDKTEMKLLAEQLTGIKIYSESLRAHSHEFMNKLHVILGMIHLKKYDDLNHYIESLVEDYEMEKSFIVQRIKNPIFAGFILGKMSKARERGIQFSVSEDSRFTDELTTEATHDLIRIAGNLIENAFDAVSSKEDRLVFFSIHPLGGKLVVEVRDNGVGIENELLETIFQKGFSTKGDERGYGLYLTKQSIDNLRGNFQVQTKVGVGTSFVVELPLC